MKAIESAIERACCKLAYTRYNVPNIKLVDATGKPDRMFMKNGRVLFVEFKAPGRRPRPLQLYEQEKLRLNGFSVHNIAKESDFISILEWWLNG